MAKWLETSGRLIKQGGGACSYKPYHPFWGFTAFILHKKIVCAKPRSIIYFKLV